MSQSDRAYDQHNARTRKDRPERSAETVHERDSIVDAARMLGHGHSNGRRHGESDGVAKLRDRVEDAAGQRLEFGGKSVRDDEIAYAEQY